MSQNKKGRKNVVVTTKKAAPTTSRRASNATMSTPTLSKTNSEELIFNKSNYMWMGIGVALILLGMLLMTGGGMPSPDVWDPNIIYGTRVTVIAPIVILAGLAIEVYAIFKD